MSALAHPPGDQQVGDELDVFHCPLDGIRLIEASAGTGKTWAICGLVLRLLLERGWTVQQVLVVTFTEAATAELRERVRSRLAEVLAAVQPEAAAPDDPFVVALLARLRGELGQSDAALAQRLDLALHSFDEAAIFTIHGFCQRALADAPFSAGMPMATEVLQDDAELRDDAIKAAWRAEVSGADLPPAVAITLLQRGDSPQHWSQLLRRMAGRPLARRRWPAALDAVDTMPVADTARLEAAFHTAAWRWQSERQAVTDLLQASLNQLNGVTYKPDAVLRGAAAWDAWFADADALATLDKTTLASLSLYTRTRLADRTKAGCRTPDHAYFDEADALFALRAEAVQTLALARAWLLRRVLEQAETALRRHKRERGLVAFDDMLFNLYERLHDRTDPARASALAATLRARYPAALIDEFQDTDPLQFAIFRRLYGGSAALGSPARDRTATTTTAPTSSTPAATLFLVGDPKQAIYSFRNADLPTYLQARALADAQYSLAHNQRSTPGLIDALNRLFTRHPHAFMQTGLLYRPVQAGAKPRSVLLDRSSPGGAHPRAALQLWRIPEDQQDGLPPLRSAAHGLALQGTAAEIARLLQQALQGAITLDERPLRAGDIAVLVRSHGQGAEVRRALASRGVRSVELSQASVHHSPEAEELARVLMAVLQPARERLLRAALATELLGRNAQALDVATQLADGLTPEMLRFGAYRDSWVRRGVGVMLRQVMVGEGLAARLLALPQGERRLTNWLHLGEALHQAESTHPAPQALLRWFEQQRSDATVTDASQQRLESDQNLVQIVTIHKSKGLEYPFVFCPFLWIGQHPAVASGDMLAYHDNVTAGTDDCEVDRADVDRLASSLRLDFRAGLDPDCDTEAIKRRLALDEAAENLRLVYVALTRAVHRCVLVVGCSASATRTGKSLTRGSHSLLNWLVAGAASPPAEWLSAQPPQTSPAAVRTAWQALVDAATGGKPASISLVDLPDVLAGASASDVGPARDDLPNAHSLAPPARLPAGWSIGSYSMMLSRGGAAVGGPAGAVEMPDQAAIDHDGHTAPADEADGDAAIGEPDRADSADEEAPDDGDAPHDRVADDASPRLPTDDILRFPRGAEAGQCFHQVFEHIDFRDPAGWPGAVDAALSGLPGTDAAERPGLAAMLMRMLHDVCSTEIAPGLQLRDVPRSHRLNEVEFHLNAPALSADALNHTLAELGYPVPPLQFGQLQGYLRGFIDLVFEHQGRTYVLDWKSNHLGNGAADYRPAACAQAMAGHAYHLQSLIYGLALDSLLRLRRADYRPADHFGGVFYLFVRGVRPGWTTADGRPCGVHLDRPSPTTLHRFAALFEIGAGRALLGTRTGSTT